MFSLIDDTAKDFVVRIKEVLEAKYKENSKENGLHNIENNNFIDLNKEIYKYIGGNEYSMVNEKGNVAPTYVNKENKNMNGNVLLNKEDKENHYVIDEIEEHKNRNGKVGLAENEIANGKANYIKSAETKTAIVNVFSDTNKIKKEIHDVRGVVSAAVDSEKLVGGYTADAIVPCAFGLKSRVMYNDKDPFAVALQSFYEMSVFNIFEKTMRQFWPAFVLFFRMRIIPKKTHDFFYNIVTSVVRARQNGEQEKRGDFIDMMMALRSDDTNNINKTADDVEITNAFIIFLGGFETTSSTLAFLFMELAAHPRVQDTMREEILRLMEKHDGNISYELLQELNYMEMVI
ncbi:putative cytochrome P450 CYP6AX1 protein, partial [Operophtera brumata]